MRRSLDARHASPRRRKAAMRAIRAMTATMATLAAAMICPSAFADDTRRMKTTQASSGVVLMIGGMATTDTAVSDRLSVVIQPGATLRQSNAVTNEVSSPSVADRVMALAPLVDEAARAADLDSALLMAVIDVESGGDPQAVSPKGATGLMQVTPDTGARHGATDLFDPRQNLAAGARYLRQLMRQFGDLPLALAAYNAGEGAVQKYGGQIPPYAETIRYVPKVMGRYLRYQDALRDGARIGTRIGTRVGTKIATRNTTPPFAQDAVRGRFLLVRDAAVMGD